MEREGVVEGIKSIELNGPLSFNSYQDKVLEASPVSELPDTELTIDVPVDTDTLNRRDMIVYTLHKQPSLGATDLIDFLANAFDCDKETIKNDINELKFIPTYQQHKARVNKAITLKNQRIIHIRSQGKKAINEAMDSSIHFDCDTILDLSLRYKLKPRHIYQEIMRYKRISTQVAINKEQHKFLPVIRALIKCTKLNLRY
ncbi:hypothetical protein [Shewanella frigidimarina]|uniref:hypothetical protein n=1 Tax=Shewanella frigidimarina TaxID=56812 RepID=UPI003D7B2C6B